MTEPIAVGSRLPVVLSRSSSRGAQIGCTLFLALLLGGIGFPVFRYPTTHPQENVGVMYIVGGGFSLVGLLLLYSALHQLFALKTPELTVETETAELIRGQKVRFFFRQPGPVSLQSLRANLVGEERWSVPRGSGSNRTTSYQSRDLGTFNFFDSGPQDVRAELPYEALIEYEVPRELEPSGVREGDHVVSWKIEVWGKVRRRADFMHSYDVTIV